MNVIKPYYMYKIVPVTLFFIISSCSSQNIKNTSFTSESVISTNQNISNMKINTQARIEVYNEKDFGSADAGSEVFHFPDGTVQYGGKRNYQPFITKCTYLLDEKTLLQLLQQNLEFQIYFKATKPAITLRDYFNSLSESKEQIHSMLFPKNLYGFQENKEKYGGFSDVFLSDRYYGPYVAVFLNDSVWYVDNIYYKGDIISKLKNLTPICEEQFVEGSIQDFVNTSPIFQIKFTEGIAELSEANTTKMYPNNGIVAAISLSPGMPNSHYFNLEIRADGTFKYTSNTTMKSIGILKDEKKKTIRFDKITALLMHYDSIKNMISDGSLAIQKMENDQQVTTIKIWNRGQLKQHTITSDSNQELINFREYFLNLIKKDIEQPN